MQRPRPRPDPAPGRRAGGRGGSPPTADPSVASIAVAGFVATIGQVALLRELLVLFHGNEMSAALALAGWLLWTAVGSALTARRASHGRARRSTIALLLSVLAVALPALVLALRGARAVLAIPAGELAPMGKMVLVCLSAPALFGPAAGALFALCWAYRRGDPRTGSPARPLAIYLGEALGAAAGGIVFYLLLLRLAPALPAAITVGLLPLGLAAWILWRRPRGRRPGIARPVWALAAGAVVLGLLTAGHLEERSRRWQWGEELALALDTPFHNIAFLRQPRQVTAFSNGLWLFTLPDPASAEPAAHLALLQHPAPRRALLLGGGLGGQLEEALKHPTIELVDYVEQDPELIRQSARFLDPRGLAALRDARVRVHHEDAATFLERRAARYDVILMSVGEPINAQMNRFFTVEMFRRLAARLLPSGILSFSLPGGGDMIGPAHARFLGSMERTLAAAFAEVAVVPGGRARFFAAREAGSLELDPAVLAERLRERRLELAHLREDTLWDRLSPLRLDYARSLLAQLAAGPVNRELAPICYLHGVGLWAAQWHPGLRRLLGAASSVRPAALAAGLAVLGALALLFSRLGRPRYRAAVAASVLVQGGVGMVLQVVLILTFQILRGFAYLQLALIIALFMAGLAAGTLWVGVAGRWRERGLEPAAAMRRFAWTQAGVTAFPLLLLALFSPAAEALRQTLSPAQTSGLFSAASLGAGLLGGAHFSLAALATAAAGGRLERAGGSLYAADLAGAAAGALVAGLVLLPLYGVPSTLALLSLASLICLLAILRRPGG